ncbi:MAG: cell division protein SepF, partial [Trichodesmium sp. St2_bin6]|nr:cell division protein SepF [Trichodesmium sp. St2_bin6]
MNNLLSKFKDFVGLNEPVEYEYDYDEMEGEQYVYPQQQQTPAAVPAQEESRSNRRLRNRASATTATTASTTGINGVVQQESGMGSVMNNVIGMPGALNGMSEVVVLEPRTFEEMPQAIRALRER